MDAKPPPAPQPPPPPPPPPQGNPAFRAMGLPNLRAKLPSRNWTIFLTLSTAFAAAVYYDRREAKRVQRHWCSVVSHISREPLSTLELPRKVTVYLSAPPGDTVSPAREYFKEYVKPVFTAAALEFEVVEGRKVGEVRWRVAEGVRKVREGDENGKGEGENTVEGIRRRNGVSRSGVQGDVVIGRHTWKEYVRGVHEGWLGPLQDLNTPAPPAEEQLKAPNTPTLDEALAETPKPEDTATKKPAIPPPHILPDAYPTAALPDNIPHAFEPVGFVPHAHILGFLNTPIRLYRFLNHRKTANIAGHGAAAVALGTCARPFDTASGGLDGCGAQEEKEWPKRVWKEEGEITEGMVVDARIVGKMRRFAMPDEVEGVEKEV